MKIMRIIISAILFIICANTFSQFTKKVDLTEYIREIQIWNKQENNMTLTFWIPSSYWRIALEDSPQVAPELINQIEKAFEDLMVVCALDLDINLDGTMTYTKEQDLRKSILILDSIGNSHFPLTDAQLSPEALAFSEAISPMFAQMLGQMGQGMHFYFFKIKDSNGANVINEYQKGRFTIKHSGKEFEYLLPLVTLLPSKKCPIDGAEMKGNWNFCPIHGVKLEE
jgi:hypothetical protein